MPLFDQCLSALREAYRLLGAGDRVLFEEGERRLAIAVRMEKFENALLAAFCQKGRLYAVLEVPGFEEKLQALRHPQRAVLLYELLRIPSSINASVGIGDKGELTVTFTWPSCKPDGKQLFTAMVIGVVIARWLDEQYSRLLEGKPVERFDVERELGSRLRT